MWLCLKDIANDDEVEKKSGVNSNSSNDKKYMTGYKAYDDDPTMCRERYTEAVRCSNLYFADIANYNFKNFKGYVDLKVDHLFPLDDQVKLNNFKQYCIAVGYETGKGSTFYGKWKYHSVFNIVDMRG